MAAKQPTHLKLFFTRSVRVQKAHIAGAKTDEGGELMEIVTKGTELTVSIIPAMDMILAESAIEVKQSNAETIANYRRSIDAEKSALSQKKKAA